MLPQAWQYLWTSGCTLYDNRNTSGWIQSGSLGEAPPPLLLGYIPPPLPFWGTPKLPLSLSSTGHLSGSEINRTMRWGQLARHLLSPGPCKACFFPTAIIYVKHIFHATRTPSCWGFALGNTPEHEAFVECCHFNTWYPKSLADRK